MTKLSDMLAGEHGDVDIIMTEENRLKLARMRAFLMDEEERYETIDPYDIAQLPQDRVEELRNVSFGSEGVEILPDDILASIEVLRTPSEQTCSHSAVPANSNSRPLLVWHACALVGCILFAFSAFLFSNNGPLKVSNAGTTTSLPFDEENTDLITMVDEIQDSVAPVQQVTQIPVVPEAIRYAGLSEAPTVMRPIVLSPVDEVLLTERVSPFTGFVDIATASNLAFPKPQNENWGTEENAWVSTNENSRIRSLMSAINTGYNSQNISQLIKDQFGDAIIVDETSSPSGMNIVVRDGDVEMHFRIVVTRETPNPASAADSVSLSPNVFAVLQAAMTEGTSVDPTRMQLNDEILGMVALGKGRYVAPEITFTRGENALRYSECHAISSEVQLAALASSCIGENSVLRSIQGTAAMLPIQASSYANRISSN